MFERFSDKARRSVVLAQEYARDRGDDMIRTEHLLLSLLSAPDAAAAELLAAFGVDRATVEADVDRLRPVGPESDAEALAALGIDLDEVRRQADEAFGPGALDRTRAARGTCGGRRWGHIPFHATAKKVLELSLREALRLRHDYIGTEHLLLGLLHTETGAAQRLLAARGVTLEQVRAAVAALGRGAASG